MVTATRTSLSEEELQEKFEGLLKKSYDIIGFEPNPFQWEALRCRKKVVFVTGGERGGKSTTGSMYLWGRAQFGKLFWIVAKDYSGCRPEFKIILQAAIKSKALENKSNPKASVSFPAKDMCWMRLAGGTLIETKSLRDPVKSIASEAPDGILICETAQIEHEDYLRIWARTMEKDGWVCGTGTLEGSLGWYPDMIQYLHNNIDSGQSFSLPSWSNTAIYPLGEDDPRFIERKRDFPEDLYMERFAAVPYKPHGLVTKEFDNDIHIKNIRFDSNKPVEISVDPGYGRGSAHVVLAIQELAGKVCVIDELYLEGMTTADMIIATRQKPWGKYVTMGAADIASKAHAAMAAPYELWRDAGILLLTKRLAHEEDGIDCLRTWLTVNPVSKEPPMYIDPKCKGLIAECGGGLDLELKRRIPGIGPWMRDVNTMKPINRNNHATKALIYWLINKYGWVSRRNQEMVQAFTLG